MKTLSPRCNSCRLLAVVLVLLLGGCGSLSRQREHGADGATQAKPLPHDYQQAVQLMRDGEYQAAIPALRSFADSHPELAGPWINLGIAYRHGGQPDKAQQALSRAIELNPDNAVAYQQAGMLYRQQGDFGAALESYNKALQLDPDYALAHRNIGILYDLYLGQPEQALAHYRRYLELVAQPDPTVEAWVIDLERRNKTAQARAKP